MHTKAFIIQLIITALVACITATAQVDPAEKYGELFKAVQNQQVFKDQKRFVDCPAKINPDSVLILYQIHKDNPEFKLKDFVGMYFDTIQADTAAMIRHINSLWNTLTRQPEPQNPSGSRIALPEPYVVPG